MSATDTPDWRRQKIADLEGQGLERRTFDVSDLQLREQDDGTLRLSGYASVTGVAYQVGWYMETIERGAFKRTLGEQPDVQLLIQHTGMPIARTTSRTLMLSEDDHGLKVEATLDPQDPDVRSLEIKMRRGDVDAMSFAFKVTADTWNKDRTKRAISAVSLHRGDVSVVSAGANPAALATVRAAEHARTQPPPNYTRRAREILATHRADPPSGGSRVATADLLVSDTDRQRRRLDERIEKVRRRRLDQRIEDVRRRGAK
ncbi:MAG: uncharacterized protein QOG15_3758 [Solirubrobacteraceae bacterium]|jgi:HK97 family phage prohead protease|nr:uncharacterized protein [Solirubrobacteraceae bacterium]